MSHDTHEHSHPHHESPCESIEPSQPATEESDDVGDVGPGSGEPPPS